MKITDIKLMSNTDMEKQGLVSAIEIYQDKNKEDRQAICINPELPITTIMLCASRLNRIVSEMAGIPYNNYLQILKGAAQTTRYEDLDLSEEQMDKLINKDVNDVLNRIHKGSKL